MPSRVQPPNHSDRFGGDLHNDEIELDENGLEPYQLEGLKETQEYYDSLPKIRDDLGEPIPNLLHWRTCCQCEDILKHRQLVVVGYGNLSAKVLFIGDGPGSDEKACGIPFVGRSGDALDGVLKEVGIGREEVFVDNLVACFEGSTQVLAPGVHTGFSREYYGDVLHVVSGDHQFTGTPNHPVLTAAGWKPLRDLVQGDYLINCRFSKGMGRSDPHIEHRPSSIKEVVGSLSENAIRYRVAGRDADFHGDGGQSQIQVVGPHGLLSDGVKAPRFHHLGKFVLEAAYYLLGLLETASSRLSSSDLRLLRVVTSALTDCPSRRSPSPTILKGRDVVSTAQRFDTRSELNTTLNEQPPQSWWTDMGLLGQGVDSLPGLVSFDQVTQINTGVLRGHVYNLGTSSGWYTAEGHIVSNCFTYSKGAKRLRQRDPSSAEIANCRQRLLDTIYQIDPYLIVTLGGGGLKALTGKPGITTNRGRLFTVKIPGYYKMVSYPLIATFHPAYILRNPALVYHRPEAQPQTKDRYIPTYLSPADLFVEDLKVVKDFLLRLDAFYMT
jgi:uracil-DNA glycosylase